MLVISKTVSCTGYFTLFIPPTITLKTGGLLSLILSSYLIASIVKKAEIPQTIVRKLTWIFFCNLRFIRLSVFICTKMHNVSTKKKRICFLSSTVFTLQKTFDNGFIVDQAILHQMQMNADC